MKLLIANGHLIDPSAPENTGMNILIEDGRVADWIRPHDSQPEVDEIFDASGLLVAPGFVDVRPSDSLEAKKYGRLLAKYWLRGQ